MKRGLVGALADRWRARCRVVGSPCGAANCTLARSTWIRREKASSIGDFRYTGTNVDYGNAFTSGRALIQNARSLLLGF